MALEIGIGLILIGLIIYLIGVCLILDRGMLAIGNVNIFYCNYGIDIFPNGYYCVDRTQKHAPILC